MAISDAVKDAAVGIAGIRATGSIAPYVPTPRETVKRMLTFAEVTARDVVYDMGCGDGRIVVGAAKLHGARGVGVDIDPARITEANRNARLAGVSHLVEFKQEDIRDVDLTPATVVALYLLPEGMQILQERMRDQLSDGSRIVSHGFLMAGWEPDATDEFFGQRGDRIRIHQWRIASMF